MALERKVKYDLARNQYAVGFENTIGKFIAGGSFYNSPSEALRQHQRDYGKTYAYIRSDSANWPMPWTNWQPSTSTQELAQRLTTVPETVNSNEVITTMQISKPKYFIGTVTKTVGQKDGASVVTFNDQPSGMVICETEEERDRQITLKQASAVSAMAQNTGLLYEVITGTIEGFAALPKPTITTF